MPDVDALFLEELARRGVTATRDAEGNYSIERDGTTLSISLFNLRKDVARDNDLGRITRFVDTILSVVKTPSWEEAKPWVRWQMEPMSDELKEALYERASDGVALVLVLASPDETQIRWISPKTAEEWGQTRDSLFAAAGDNMLVLAEKMDITFEEIDGHKLGMIGTEWPAYKAALVFSRGFRARVEPVLGWPVFAVMPCRDFVYIVPAKDKELLPRMGPVVVKEYKQGAYPLSTEVFELVDQGIRAAFEFQKSPTGDAHGAGEATDPLWRIVQYGGFLRFRVPVAWSDENQDQGADYFDPKGVGRLHVLVMGMQGRKATDYAAAGEHARILASQENGEVTPRDGTAWLVESPPAADDSGRTAWTWRLVAAVPPNAIHLVTFTYRVPTATLTAEPERVEAERAMVRQEVVTAFFNPVPIPAEEKPAKHKPAPPPRPKRDKGDKN